MIGRPVQHRMLECGRTEQQVEGFDEAAALVSAVCEVTIVTCRDAEGGRGDVQQEEEDLEGVDTEERDVESAPR